MISQLQAKREELGLSRKAVARAVGISQMAYYRYEKGVRTPAVLTAIKIAEVLKSTVEQLFPSGEREGGE